MISQDADWVNICESRVDGDGYSITVNGDKVLLPTNNLGMFVNLSVEPFELTRGKN